MLVKRERVLWLLAVFAACADGLPVDSKLIDDLPREECAQVIGCTCATPRRLDCSGVAHDVFEQMAIFYPLLNTLTITNFAEESLNLTRLANLTKLATLRITDSYLTTLDSDEDGSGPPNLGHLDLRRNTIENWTLAMCSWIDVGALSRLRTLDVRENQLSSIDECRGVPSFQVLDANDNKVPRRPPVQIV